MLEPDAAPAPDPDEAEEAVVRTAMAETFPGMPPALIEEWLIPHADRYGWPPQEDAAGKLLMPWQASFAPYSLADIRATRWERTSLPYAVGDFEEYTRLGVGLLITRYVGEAYRPTGAVGVRRYPQQLLDTVVAGDEMWGGPDRFTAAVQYLREHGTMPGVPVVMPVPGGYRIQDGMHRIAALCVYRKSTYRATLDPPTAAPAQRHAAWIGHPPRRRGR